MKLQLKRGINIRIAILSVVAACCGSHSLFAGDTIPSGFRMKPVWRIGAEVSPAFVPGTSSFLRGENFLDKKINSMLSATFRADFSFNNSSREGMLYPGLYQGIGIGGNSFFANNLLRTPVSAYVYQGAPIAHFNRRLWLGYEWKFGVAFGWKHYDEESADNNAVVSTPVTALMGLGVKLHYQLSDCWQMFWGAEALHFSNGNTSYPNAGVNSVGASVGIAYTIRPQIENRTQSKALEMEADRGEWFYDIMAYGAWRKRIVSINDELKLCPGRFGIIGLQFSPMRKLNRWVAVGPSLDVQWDESGGLAPYWIEGTYDEDIKFARPPFGKQLGVGVSAHAELTMPIFAVNAGLGYDIVNPQGNKRFYQSLTLKTFIARNVYLNVGYRLGNFNDPQNLMLGVGVRLYQSRNK